jgi:hypothetical protein
VQIPRWQKLSHSYLAMATLHPDLLLHPELLLF